MGFSVFNNKFQAYSFIISTLVVYVQCVVPKPRGVSLSKLPLYSPSKDFTCFDGTITIPFSYVNDDYCDCFDGSDEPGTSACLNGVFHCLNTGHRPKNIPSSRVNDGVCDCCDGSDEYATKAGCRDICNELGRQDREEAERLASLYKEGSKHRMLLINEGNRKRVEMGQQLAQLENDKLQAEKIKAEKEALKDEWESKENEVLEVYRKQEEEERKIKEQEEKEKNIKEATDYFNKINLDADDKLSLDEIKAATIFDKNKDNVVDEDELKFFLINTEGIDKDTFISTTWPLLKPYMMMEQGMFRPETKDSEEAVEGEEEEYKEQDVEDLENDEGIDSDHEDEQTEEHIEEHNEDHEPEVNDPEPKTHSKYDPETQKIVDAADEARRQLREAERTIHSIESNIRSINENLEKEYGPQNEYASLDGQCFEYEDTEYVYRLCLFQKVTQKSKNSGSEIGLGNWGEWAGEGKDKFSVMKYTNGVACWNGPNRVTTVNIQCGLETKLLSVAEPYRCEYRIELSTPAACDESTLQAEQHSSHDEL